MRTYGRILIAAVAGWGIGRLYKHNKLGAIILLLALIIEIIISGIGGE